MGGMIFQLVCLLSRAKTRRELSLSLYSPPIDGIYSADGVRAMEGINRARHATALTPDPSRHHHHHQREC